MPRVTVDTDVLGTALASTDPTIAMAAATAAAFVEQNPPADATLRLFDNFYHEIDEINDHIECKLTQPRQAIPTGSLILKGGYRLADNVLACDTTVVPFIYDKGGYRWSGRVDVAHDRLKDGVYCLDVDTEILTAEGFKRHDQLRGDEQVLTLNMDTGLSEWQPVLSVHTFDVQDIEMLSMETRGHSSLSTLNHRWPVRVVHGSRWQSTDEITIRESTDLNLNCRLIPSAPCASLPTVAKYDDAFVELVAWFITEGTIRVNNSGTLSTGVRIGQSTKVNPLYVERIRASLTALWGTPTDRMNRPRGPKQDWNPEWRERPDQHHGMTVFDLNTIAGRTLIEIAPNRVVAADFIASLTAAQLRLFVETCIDADGWRESKTGQVGFSQNCLERLEPVQMAATLLGMPTAVTRQRDMFSMTFYRHRGTTQPHRHTKTTRTVRFSGTVWCPKTQNSTWLARRNGTVYFTGNTIECELIHDKVWLDRILAWPDPLAPIEIQGPFRDWWGIGPAITVMKTLIAEQCFRLQTGLWELVNNLGSLNLDWESWFGTILIQGGLSVQDLIQALTTPVFVVPTDPLFDTSPWIELDGRMDTCWKLIQQQVKDNGLDVQVAVWLPGEPQPHGALFPLRVPTIVVDIKDRSGITGFSGTFLDGLEIDLVQLEGSLLGNTLAPILNPGNAFAPPGVIIAPEIGVDFAIPWVVFNCDTPKGGVIEHDVAHHHPLAWQLLLGGKSPKWLVCAPPGNWGGTDKPGKN